MNTDNNYKNLIEQYLDGELHGEELDKFELELQTNVALREELKAYQLAHQIIVKNKIVGLEEMVQEVKQEYVKISKKNQIKKAVIIGLLGLGLFTAVLIYLNQSPEIVKQKNVIPPKEKLEENKVSSQFTVDTIVVNSNEVVQTQTSSHSIKNDSSHSIQHNLTTIDKNETIEKQVFVDYPLNVGADNNVKVLETSDKKEMLLVVIKDKCEGVVIEFDVVIAKPCRGEDNGVVEFKNIRGGTAPYSLALSGEVTSDFKMYQVSKGTLEIEIKDVNGCTLKPTPIAVQEQFCTLDLYLDPASGRPVEFPKYEKSGVLTVFDKRGNVKFETLIESHQTLEWLGIANEGMLIAGYYLFTIQYEDGAMQKGSITITP